jgi:glycosyltransferase involved in cell wall biosynthesis
MVSAIIVARNSEEYIVNCIQSIINQFKEGESWELLLIDGASTDTTKQKSSKFLKATTVKYRIIDNPQKTLATGWNLGVKEALGEYVVRPDAHAELLDGYISKGIEKLKKNDLLAGVGGTLITKSQSFLGRLIAIVLSNPIGVGHSLFRIGVTQDTFTNTVVYAVYRKRIFEELGGLNEDLERNQDIDFHKRILNSGYKLLTANNMKAVYYSRTSIKKFLIQGFQNGYWIMFGESRHLNHLIPMFFVIFMIAVFLLCFKFFITFIFIHFLASILSFSFISNIYNPIKLFILWGLTFTLHIVYGFGSLVGFYKKLFSR